MNADTISLETTLLADGRTLIVKNLEIESFISFVNMLKIGIIIVRNFNLDKYRQLHGQYQVLTTDNIAGYDLLTQLSLQNFEIAFDIENILIEEIGFLRSQLDGRVNIKNHFSTDIEFDARIPLPIFWEIMKYKDAGTIFSGEFGYEVAQSSLTIFFQSDAALSRVSWSLRDYGTLERLLNLYAKYSGQTVTEATDDIRLNIDQLMKESISDKGMYLFPAIEKFLDHGGQLRLYATPDAPVRFLSFASYFLMPKSAFQQLNVKNEQLN